MSGAEDRLLIERAVQGEREAFDQLVRKHERRAYQYAFRLTRSPEEAADIVAEAFFRVYSALRSFRQDSAFGTWLYRIVTNCYLDAQKKSRSRQTTSLSRASSDDDAELELQIEDTSPLPDETALEKERARALQRAIDALPEYQRAMIVMYHGEQLSYEEIAEALDLPIGTVKSRLNRARLSLRDLLSRDLELFRE
ncbi:MAG TPA: RNA polymerase subunit sigma-24 [Armatimonadetes bacterium]|jgi:RNA polymerase sigma-70 factor (ECF subfamily)|nr:RNA polymerase subunit sigma-24 [Armatimonadota bacterium]